MDDHETQVVEAIRELWGPRVVEGKIRAFWYVAKKLGGTTDAIQALRRHQLAFIDEPSPKFGMVLDDMRSRCGGGSKSGDLDILLRGIRQSLIGGGYHAANDLTDAEVFNCHMRANPRFDVAWEADRYVRDIEEQGRRAPAWLAEMAAAVVQEAK